MSDQPARPGELTPEERAVLEVGCAYYELPGEIENKIRDLGLTPNVFAQQLNTLLETERALAADPVNVYRLRRLRDARMRERFSYE